MRKKILILDNNERLVLLLKETITKYDVIPAFDLTEATEKINEHVISFIAVDYDLGEGNTGDLLSNLILANKKSLPSIVFSGKDLSDGIKKSLKDKGFLEILSKVDGTIGSDLIEKTVDQILSNCEQRNYDIKIRSSMVDNGDYPLEFQGIFKTIDEWIQALSNCEYSEHENIIRQLIIDHCAAIFNRKLSRDFSEM